MSGLDSPPGNTPRHEAAHAVVAHVLGGEVRLVTVESEEEGHEGHTEVLWPARDRDLALRHGALAALAGPLAELEHEGRHLLEEPETLAAWGRDWAEVDGALQALERDPEARQQLLHQWIRDVADLVADVVVAEHIARVADALETHGTLDETLFQDCLG